MASFPQSLVPSIQDGLQWMVNSPEFIKDDLPSNASGGAKFLQETGRRVCRQYARVRSATSGIAYAPVYSNLCTPYLDSINEKPISDGNYAPPFTGGMCVGVQYNVRQRIQAWDSNGNFLSDETVVSTGGPGPVSYTALPNIMGVPGSTNAYGRFRLTYANGSSTVYTSIGTSVTTGKKVSQRDVSLIRADGQPDNCGNVPPYYRPPVFPTNLPSLPPPTNPAPGGGNNWEVNILPDGEINFCIAGDCSGSIPPDGGGGPDSGGGPGEPDGPPQETNPNDPNDPNEVSGCVEDGNLLTGLKIQVTQAPPNYQGLGDIYYKSCWVWMGPSSDLLDMVIDGRTLESGQFVIPDSKDCTCFKVRANPGFKVSVQPYSRPKEE